MKLFVGMLGVLVFAGCASVPGPGHQAEVSGEPVAAAVVNPAVELDRSKFLKGAKLERTPASQNPRPSTLTLKIYKDLTVYGATPSKNGGHVYEPTQIRNDGFSYKMSNSSDYVQKNGICGFYGLKEDTVLKADQVLTMRPVYNNYEFAFVDAEGQYALHCGHFKYGNFIGRAQEVNEYYRGVLSISGEVTTKF